MAGVVVPPRAKPQDSHNRRGNHQHRGDGDQDNRASRYRLQEPLGRQYKQRHKSDKRHEGHDLGCAEHDVHLKVYVAPTLTKARACRAPTCRLGAVTSPEKGTLMSMSAGVLSIVSLLVVCRLPHRRENQKHLADAYACKHAPVQSNLDESPRSQCDLGA